MNPLLWPGNPRWTPLSRILFRFVFVCFLLYVAPWTFMACLLKRNLLTRYEGDLENWSVQSANRSILYGFKERVLPNGRGDTSWNCTHVALLLLAAVNGDTLAADRGAASDTSGTSCTSGRFTG